MAGGGSIFLRSAGKSISGHSDAGKIDIFRARELELQREHKVRLVNKTQTEELKKHEEERDLFCIVNDAFRVFARRSALLLGSAWAFAAALLVILVWLITGPTFHFSDTWQLIINTGTTIVTFLMVFLIQNTQNRDAKAMHLKLDEVIHALKKARNEMVDLEELSDEELDRLEQQFRRVRTKAEKHGTNMRHVEPSEDEDQTR
jgi:Predicted small integral membrane protein